jgi:hypothetical protein
MGKGLVPQFVSPDGATTTSSNDEDRQMALFTDSIESTNSLDSASAPVTLSKRNFLTLHHNGSISETQYDRTSSNGFRSLDGHGQQDIIAHPAEHNQSDAFPSVNGSTTVQPVWNRERRELRIGEIVVKRFKWPAENQERVLDAFQESGWPDHIDDPLQSHPNICPKRRLHDTLKCLNRKQIQEAIKFRGDGTGLGIRLEIVNDNDQQ